jgi:hypothetical protein
VFITSLLYAVLKWRVLDMASTCVSGTVTVNDQRSYIKIEILRCKNTTEIHTALREVYGEQWVWPVRYEPVIKIVIWPVTLLVTYIVDSEWLDN